MGVSLVLFIYNVEHNELLLSPTDQLRVSIVKAEMLYERKINLLVLDKALQRSVPFDTLQVVLWVVALTTKDFNLNDWIVVIGDHGSHDSHQGTVIRFLHIGPLFVSENDLRLFL